MRGSIPTTQILSRGIIAHSLIFKKLVMAHFIPKTVKIQGGTGQELFLNQAGVVGIDISFWTSESGSPD